MKGHDHNSIWTILWHHSQLGILEMINCLGRFTHRYPIAGHEPMNLEEMVGFLKIGNPKKWTVYYYEWLHMIGWLWWFAVPLFWENTKSKNKQHCFGEGPVAFVSNFQELIHSRQRERFCQPPKLCTGQIKHQSSRLWSKIDMCWVMLTPPNIPNPELWRILGWSDHPCFINPLGSPSA